MRVRQSAQLVINSNHRFENIKAHDKALINIKTILFWLLILSPSFLLVKFEYIFLISLSQSTYSVGQQAS